MNIADSHDKTALEYASQRGHHKCIGLLIKAGANVNREMRNGATNLILAAENGHKECVNLLIKGGVDVNRQSGYGLAALILAADERP